MAKSIEDLLVVMGELYTDTVAFRLKGDDYSTLEIISAPEGFVLPSEKELRDKLSWAIESRGLKLLRWKRDQLLAESDWRAGQDVPAMSQEWKDYRQALRDLPSTSPNPTWSQEEEDDMDELKNVTWPTKPSS